MSVLLVLHGGEIWSFLDKHLNPLSVCHLWYVRCTYSVPFNEIPYPKPRHWSVNPFLFSLN